MPRLFTALEFPAALRAELALLRGGVAGANWVEPDDYHLTLRFIGDVDRRMANDIAEALQEIRAAPLTVELTELAVFGADRPRALVARVKAEPALVDLQADHEMLMRRLGLPAETRKFTPHVTLAHLRGVRAADVTPYLSAHGPLRLAMTVASFALLSARPRVGGGPYRRAAIYPLAGAG